MAISPELARVYASAPDDDYYIETMQLTHPGFVNEVRYLTNESGGFDGTLEDGETVVYYEPIPFAVIPPKSGDEGAIHMQVVIDNVGKALVDELEELSKQPTTEIEMIFRIYLKSDLTVVQNDPPLKMSVLGVVMNNAAVTFEAGLMNIRTLPFPSRVYDIDMFPGLYR